MKKKLRIYNILIPILAILSVVWACREDDEFSKDYDINWPVPTIAAIDPADKAMVESEITITGTGFEKIMGVVIDGKNCVITDTTPTAIKVKLPRIFKTSAITITNLYRQSVVSEAKISPEYPSIVVTSFPANIQQEQLFAIKGENVDLITSIKINGKTITVSSTSPTTLNVPSAGLGLAIGDKVTIEAISSLTTIVGGMSGEIEVIANNPLPALMKPLVLFDFEDNVNPYVSAGLGTATLDGAGVKKGRGEHYLTVKASGIETWKDLGYIEIANAVQIDSFTHPHLTFLVNTNGKAGYFQFEDNQGNWYHFKQNPDDYKFATNGWEWRSYDLKKIDDGKPLNFSNFKAKLMFKSGNVSGDFEIHIDQVMITNGKVAPVAKLWDFEDNGTSPFAVLGNSPTHGFNASTVPSFMEGGYYTVIKNQVGGWTDLGKFEHGETFNLSELKDPHLTFWINTNGKQGYFQLEDGQGSWLHFKFGGDDYKFAPTNGWAKRSIPLTQVPWEGAGFNPAAFKPTFTVKTGNVGNGGTPEDFELNLDEVYISDGPMF